MRNLDGRGFFQPAHHARALLNSLHQLFGLTHTLQNQTLPTVQLLLLLYHVISIHLAVCASWIRRPGSSPVHQQVQNQPLMFPTQFTSQTVGQRLIMHLLKRYAHGGDVLGVPETKQLVDNGLVASYPVLHSSKQANKHQLCKHNGM